MSVTNNHELKDKNGKRGADNPEVVFHQSTS